MLAKIFVLKNCTVIAIRSQYCVRMQPILALLNTAADDNKSKFITSP